MVIFAIGARGDHEDCNMEHIHELTQKCRDELREKSTGSFSTDCETGVLQEHIDCMSEIINCENLPIGTTELTLTLQYGNSSLFGDFFESPTPASEKKWWGRRRCRCRWVCCSWWRCRRRCRCGRKKRESEVVVVSTCPQLSELSMKCFT